MQEYLSLHISIMPSRAAVQRIHLFSVFSLHAFYICECVPLGTRIEPATPDKRPADLSPWSIGSQCLLFSFECPLSDWMFPTIFSADNFRDHIFQALLRHKVSLIHAVIAFCYSEDSPSPHLR